MGNNIFVRVKSTTSKIILVTGIANSATRFLTDDVFEGAIVWRIS